MTTMNRLIRLLIALAFAGLGSPAFAQTYNTPTSLSTAVTVTAATSVQVASTSGFTKGWQIYVDAELMTLTGYPNSSNACSTTTGAGNCPVARGAVSTIATTHAKGAIVYWGPPYEFVTRDVDGQGQFTGGGASCTAANYLYLPIINVIEGNLWWCRATSSTNGAIQSFPYWYGTNATNLNYNSIPLAPLK